MGGCYYVVHGYWLILPGRCFFAEQYRYRLVVLHCLGDGADDFVVGGFVIVVVMIGAGLFVLIDYYFPYCVIY